MSELSEFHVQYAQIDNSWKLLFENGENGVILNDIKLRCTQKQIIWCTDSDTKDE